MAFLYREQHQDKKDVECLRESWTKEAVPFRVFFSCFFLLVGFALLAAFVTHGLSLQNLVRGGYTLGSFPDFCESLYDAYDRNPYAIGAIYPAFAYLVFYAISRFIPWSIFENLNGDWSGLVAGHSTVQIVLYVAFGLMVFLLCYVVYQAASGNKARKKLCVLTVLCSSAFAAVLERGNIVLLAITMNLVFALWYDDASPKKRFLAYSMLAMAVSLKLYPVLLGLVLLDSQLFRKNGWKAQLRNIALCVGLGLAFFLLPFLLFGGIAGIQDMLTNILNHSGKVGELGLGFRIDLNNFVQMIGAICGKTLPLAIPHLTLLMGLVAVVGVVASFLSREKWKKIALLSLIMILCPTFSSTYTNVYLLVPLLLFLNAEPEESKKKRSIFYAVLFALSLAPIGFGSNELFPNAYPDMSMMAICNLGTVVPAVIDCILFLSLVLDGFVCAISRLGKNRLEDPRKKGNQNHATSPS